jgi:YhcN/YlaJ family sporulation lipoprotein
MKRMALAAVTAAAALSLVACGGNTAGNKAGNGAMNANRVDTGGDIRPYGMNGDTWNNRNGNDRIADYGFRDGGRDVPQRNGLHRNSRLEASDELAERIADLNEVDRAMVFLTDRNAYVGVVLESDVRTRNAAGGTDIDGSDRDFGNPDTDDRLSKRLKDRIAELVKERQPDVRNVFVSANPGFLDSLNDYMADLNNGRPVAGLVEEFNDMVERIFPTRAGDGFDNVRNGVNDMGNARGMQKGSGSPFTKRAR